MPYTKSQNRLFYYASHNPAVAKEHGLSQAKALELAKEGVKGKKKKRNKLAEMAK